MENKESTQKPEVTEKRFEKKVKTLKEKTQEFENIVKEYLESNPLIRSHRKNNELEIRFGTNTRISQPLSKIDYDNVAKQLYSCGFKLENKDGVQMMRITPESIDPRTGKKKLSIRGELIGIDLIQEYCRTNSLQSVINMPSTLSNKIKFTRKMNAIRKDGSFIDRLDMDDFNFRVSFQTEQDYNVQSDTARNIISNWMDSKKLFRFMNRVRFYHPDLPIFADLSIVKSSNFITTKDKKKIPVPEYTIQEANVFNNIEQYEIELEIDNSRVGVGTPYNKASDLMAAIRKTTRIVLSGLQGTKFPISYTEQEKVLKEYIKVVHGDEHEQNYIGSSEFIGPSSFTLQIDNVVPISETIRSPNVRKDFTVTDKADGDRKLLFVSDNGNIYMIDTNMNVIFTGTKTIEKTIFNSIVDGEHIKYNKKSEYINLYAAFDVYYVNKKNVREFPFYKDIEEIREEKEKKERKEEKDNEITYRLYLLKHFVDLLKPISVLELTGKEEVQPVEQKKPTEFIVKCKTFRATSENTTIFECCQSILSDIKDGTYEYNTDGLIFTPSNLAVGGTSEGGPPGKLAKTTWSHSFKWKPVEFNTIDFLVSIKKDKTGKHEVHHIFQDGLNLQGGSEVQQYKTLVLHVGFDSRTDGYINPFQDLITDNLPDRIESNNKRNYKPVPFVPTNPYDPNACFCNIMLKEDGSKLFMMTEEGEYFEDDMIVEFKYVNENKDGWKWVPLRVRYDKTAQLRTKKNNFGNAYKVANNNWYSIHHPITEEMITTGNSIPDSIMDDEVYYARSNEETSTRALRNFHNLYVKKNLILGVSRRGDKLIDIAVGKAGDLQKWITAKLSFVLGVDISKDNIHNQIDGACARYLNEYRKSKDIPKALFINGDSGLNIRSGQAFATEKDKQIAKAVFGQGPKDKNLLGAGVYNQYGVAETGFNITSCQFAMHYMFKNKTTFHQLLRNIAECTRLNGYYIGTCYDGKTVFNLLQNLKNEEGVTIMKEGRKIYEIVKMYDQTGFPDEEMSLGYGINVFQESINQYFREYLVNFDYFIRIMEDYGFLLVTKDEAKHMNLPNGSGMFSDLFTKMELEIKSNPNVKANYRDAIYMSTEEKRISFMNRYFVFKKVRDVDAKKMAVVITKESEFQEKHDEEEVKELEKTLDKINEVQQDVVEEEKEPVKKTKRLVLKKEAPAQPPIATISKEKFSIVLKK